MDDFPEPFDATAVPQDERTFDLLPVGDYHMQVIDADMQETKSGSGEMLVLTLEILDGPYQNRKLWDRLNIKNTNPDAERIAQRSLADLCLSVGITVLEKKEQLKFKPFLARVGIRKDKTGQWPDRNTVRYKKPLTNGQTKPASAKAAPAAGSKPWKK